MSPGTEGRKLLRGSIDAAQQQSREWQENQRRRTGYCTPQAELGHAITAEMLARGYHPTIAQVAGQLGAVATAYNWQGNARIADNVGRCKRTVQRVRARLEADGLIRSELLLTGDMIDGQRAPVWHPQVVRDVSALQRLARARDAVRAPHRKSKRRPSAADVPNRPPPTSEPAHDAMTAADHLALGEAHPEFSAFFSDMATAAAKHGAGKPPPTTIAPPEIDPSDIDAVELDIERRERERGRDPPKRGPPETR